MDPHTPQKNPHRPPPIDIAKANALAAHKIIAKPNALPTQKLIVLPTQAEFFKKTLEKIDFPVYFLPHEEMAKIRADPFTVQSDPTLWTLPQYRAYYKFHLQCVEAFLNTVGPEGKKQSEKLREIMFTRKEIEITRPEALGTDAFRSLTLSPKVLSEATFGFPLEDIVSIYRPVFAHLQALGNMCLEKDFHPDKDLCYKAGQTMREANTLCIDDLQEFVQKMGFTTIEEAEEKLGARARHHGFDTVEDYLEQEGRLEVQRDLERAMEGKVDVECKEKASEPEVESGLACEVCGKMDKTSKCTKCWAVAYCGKDHQKQYWAQHKAVCKEATDSSGVGKPQEAGTEDRTVLSAREPQDADMECGGLKRRHSQ